MWLAGSLATCGRSENIGWADREIPENAGQRAADQQAAGQNQADLQIDLQVVAQEYNSLGQTLVDLQKTAMADPELSAQWGILVAEVDAIVIENSSFHRGLAERRTEIESRLAASERGEGESLSPEELAELEQYHRNIQMEMARIRREAFQGTEFSGRYLDLQAALYEKMKELDPSRARDIDRLQQLEWQLYFAQQTQPQGPDMSPVR